MIEISVLADHYQGDQTHGEKQAIVAYAQLANLPIMDVRYVQMNTQRSLLYDRLMLLCRPSLHASILLRLRIITALFEELLFLQLFCYQLGNLILSDIDLSLDS